MGLYDKIHHIETKWDEKVKQAENEAETCNLEQDKLLKIIMDIQKKSRTDMKVMLEKERKKDSFLDSVIGSIPKGNDKYSSSVKMIEKKYAPLYKMLMAPKADPETEDRIAYLELAFDMVSDDYVTLQRTAKRQEFVKFNAKTAIAAGSASVIALAFGSRLPKFVKYVTGPAISGITNAVYLGLDKKFTKESMDALGKRAKYIDDELTKIYDPKMKKYFGEK